MKYLTIVRHAKSSWKEPLLTDFERPLNKRGKADAPEMGRRLAVRGARPDLIVTSPARRARKTALIMAKALGVEDEIEEEGAIYEAGVTALVQIVRGLDEKAGHVMIVGHNPGFTDLAEHLSGRVFGNIPTGGVVGLEFEVDAWSDLKRGGGRVVFTDFPKDAPPP